MEQPACPKSGAHRDVRMLKSASDLKGSLVHINNSHGIWPRLGLGGDGPGLEWAENSSGECFSSGRGGKRGRGDPLGSNAVFARRLFARRPGSSGRVDVDGVAVGPKDALAVSFKIEA